MARRRRPSLHSWNDETATETPPKKMQRASDLHQTLDKLPRLVRPPRALPPSLPSRLTIIDLLHYRRDDDDDFGVVLRLSLARGL